MEKEIALLKQELEMHQKTSEEKIKTLTENIEQLTKRVGEIEASKQKTEYQYQQIMKTLEKLNDITIPNLTKQIQELKNKPAERYNLIITAIISTVIGGIVTFIINNFLKS